MSGPNGSTYSVKYLGIVDGAMGILSRKMAMQGLKNDSRMSSTGIPSDKRSFNKET